MEAEVICEVGAWKNFDEIEEELCLDELFLLYEATSERQRRLLQVIGASMGASTGGSIESNDDTNNIIDQPIDGEDGAHLFAYFQQQGE